jgi:hypothetical protein
MRRRHFLRGLGGALLALPLLEGLGARTASARDAGAPFALVMRQGNGVQQATSDGEPERYWPSFAPGAITSEQLASDNGRALSELSAHATSLNIVRGVRFGDPANACKHSGGGNQALTGARVTSDECNTTLALDESLDNRIARQLGSPGEEPLTLFAGTKTGMLDEILSYRGARQLRAAERSPLAAYQDLFGVMQLDPAERAQLGLRRKSVNDLVRGELNQLLARTDLSRGDRLRLDQHLSAIRDLEHELAGAGFTDAELQNLTQASSRLDDDENLETVIKLHCDVMVLAVASGARRAATLQLGAGADMNRYRVDGVLGPTFHEISHRAGVENAVDLHHKTDRKLLGFYKYLLDKLATYAMPAGTLLDYGLTLYVVDVANKFHEYENVPYLLAGRAGGAIKTGQYVDLGGVTNNKLLNTVGRALGLMNAEGHPLDDFGDKELERGAIDALLAT